MSPSVSQQERRLVRWSTGLNIARTCRRSMAEAHMVRKAMSTQAPTSRQNISGSPVWTTWQWMFYTDILSRLNTPAQFYSRRSKIGNDNSRSLPSLWSPGRGWDWRSRPRSRAGGCRPSCPRPGTCSGGWPRPRQAPSRSPASPERGALTRSMWRVSRHSQGQTLHYIVLNSYHGRGVFARCFLLHARKNVPGIITELQISRYRTSYRQNIKKCAVHFTVVLRISTTFAASE